jgi:hypothetical protein
MNRNVTHAQMAVTERSPVDRTLTSSSSALPRDRLAFSLVREVLGVAVVATVTDQPEHKELLDEFERHGLFQGFST